MSDPEKSHRLAAKRNATCHELTLSEDLNGLIRRVQELDLPHSFESLGVRGSALHELGGARLWIKQLEQLASKEDGDA